MIPTRDDLLSLLDQFGEVCQVSEAPQVWVPSYENKREQVYIDEEHKWQKYLEDRLYQAFYEAEVSSLSDPYTVINSRFKCSFDHLYFSKENPCVIGEITKETDTKLEDVDLDEFEKVLNGD